MKICSKCNTNCSNDDFYKGYAQCKECVKARVRKHRADNIERIQEYDRARGRTEERKAYQKALRSVTKPNSRGHQKRWSERNPEKRKAHIAVGNAVQYGKLTKQPCEVCGSTKVHAHHDDYSKPLEVRWLCHDHHGETWRQYQ